MSRFRRVVHGIASGYLLLICNSLYSIITVPIALHYLSKERFALWALMSGIAGYLNLVDLGMSGSVARLLVDHKDGAREGTYGGLIKTGWTVLLAQGTLVFLVGFGLAPLICRMLAIEPGLQSEFIALVRWQTTSLGLAFALRIFSHILTAHQRSDIYNYNQMGATAVNFVALWLFFRAGHGVFSLAYATLLASATSSFTTFLGCWWLKLLPCAGAWGRVSWKQFKEIFGYGKDMFLVAVGSQLIMASQTMIITRQLGLEAAAAWAIGTKMFLLVSQIVWRIFDVSSPAFSEMIVRKEQAILRERYRAVLLLTGSLTVCAAVIFALCNSGFVTVWTHGKISWAPGNDVLLAAWMIVTAIFHVHGCFVLLTKEIGFMRYVYFMEGIVFVCAAVLAAKWGGLPAIILCSIACSTIFSGAYGVWRMSHYFHVGVYEVGVEWLAPSLKVLALFAPMAFAIWLLSQKVTEPILGLAMNAVAGGLIGLWLFLHYGLPRNLLRELLSRAPGASVPFLRFFASNSR